MFEINKDCSRDRERLEKLWHDKTENEYKNRTKPSNTPAPAPPNSRVAIIWSMICIMATSFFMSTIAAFAFTISGIKPTQEPPKPKQTFTPPVTNSTSEVATRSTAFATPAIAATRSTITGHIDSRTLTAAQYWTMILRSDSGSRNQGEFDLVLPVGTALNRVTLWINGKPQEAAFNATQRVKAAYAAVVRKARDPVLVTWKDSKRVHIKVFPVSSSADFKFRIGMTTPIKLDQKGRMKMTVPYVDNSGLRFDTIQDIHFESDVPLSCSRYDVKSQRQGTKFLVKGNIPAERLESLSLEGIRGSLTESFATRATHSNPPAVILARLAKVPGGEGLIYEKSSVLPSSLKYFDSPDVAQRISTLWAASTINKLVESGDRSQAVDLAMTYRIVSPVSGATVLERESDYKNSGLHREMYRTSNYVSDKSLVSTANDAFTLQGATNGSIGPQGQDATSLVGVYSASDRGINTVGNLRVNRIADIESCRTFAGPVYKWLTGSCRDANLFDVNLYSDPDSNSWGGTSIRSFLLLFGLFILPVLLLSALTFWGAMTLFVLAVKNRKQSGVRNKLLVLSALWMALAVVSPGLSQLALLPAAACLLHPRFRAIILN